MVAANKSVFKLWPKQKPQLRKQDLDLDFSLVTVPPLKVRFGWAGNDPAQRALDKIGDNFPRFFIAHQTVASDRKRVCLWDFSLQVLGQHIMAFTQEDGDCTAVSLASGIQYLECVEIAKLGEAERYRPIYQPYIYGCGRVFIGKKVDPTFDLNEAGATGIWVAEAVRQFGTIAADHPGVPPYSGDVSRDWGFNGPPRELVPVGREHIIKTIAQVKNYYMVRDALANGYPVTVASRRGFKMKGVIEGGKLWGVPEGVWPHQMVFIAVDDDPRRPGCYCMNSWGPNAHGLSPDGAPPGGFWIDAHVVDKMTAIGDSWAVSQYVGFPEQNLDFLLISSQKLLAEKILPQRLGRGKSTRRRR